MNAQQEYIVKLQKKVTPALMVCKETLNSTTDKYSPGFRQEPSQVSPYDHRTVAINEIVFDLDWNSYVRNYTEAKKIIEALKSYNIEPLVCATGGKGIHIHVFFEKIKFKHSKNKELLKEAFQYGLTYKAIRLWFWNLILDDIGSDYKFRGDGGKFDSHPLSFNYFNGTSALIRDIGGKKHVKNSSGEWNIHYKTYIPLKEFNKKNPKVISFSDVQFPESIPTFQFDEYKLSGFLLDFINKAKSTNSRKLINHKLPCKYTEIDGVLKVREGMSTGHRSKGAFLISVACKIDRFTKEHALELLNEYVSNCSQTDHTFTLSEAKQWLEWVYGSDNTYWNCSQLKDLDAHDPDTCEFCQMQNKEAIKFLNSSTMLNEIQEVLDQQVIGEGHNKMLIFLLLLSKDFPSETGKPGWTIPGDPFSQNIILSSDSASGKTYIIKQILKLFGEEGKDYIVISRITKSAFNYYTLDNMDGKIMFIEELQGLDEHTEQLRVWMSEGKLSLTSVEKVKQDDGTEILMKSDKITIGQPCFVTCQAEGVVGDQLLNRSWVLSTDVTETQSKRILDYQSKLNRGEITFDSSKVQIIKDGLKQLKPYHFIIPFADDKLMNIPTNDVRVRRDFNKFLTLIKCVGYLNQKRRKKIIKNGKEFLICQIEDYEIARQYSESVLGATFSGLTNNQIDILNFIKATYPNDCFKISNLQQNLGKSQPYWYGVLKQLTDLGYLTCEGKPGMAAEYTLVQTAVLNIMSLPSGEELQKKIDSRT